MTQNHHLSNLLVVFGLVQRIQIYLLVEFILFYTLVAKLNIGEQF